MNEIHRLAYYVLSREALNLAKRDNKITPTMDVPYVRSMILRLEHAAVNSSWEVSFFYLKNYIYFYSYFII